MSMEAKERREVYTLVILHAMIVRGAPTPDPQKAVDLADATIKALDAPPQETSAT